MSPMCKRLSSLASVFLHPRSARFAVVVVEVLEPCDQPEPAEVDLVRARVVADVVGPPRPVGEKRQARLAGAKRMRDPRPGGTRDHMAGPDRLLLVGDAGADALRARMELQRSLAVEHDEDLLVGGVAVRRR